MELNFNLEGIGTAAAEFLQATGSHNVIAFRGDMGAGKTSFIHALCIAKGVVHPMSSPTFSLINQYTSGSGKTIYHMDLYRINGEAEAINAGVEDCLYGGADCLVEWPEKAPHIFPPSTLYATLSVTGVNSRKLEINL